MSEDTDIKLLIGRMDGKLDLVLTNQTNHTSKLEDHGNRIAALEAADKGVKSHRSYLVSVGSLAVAAFAVLKDHIWK